MAYYTGTASSYADLRTALLTHAQSDGWVLTGDVLSKAGVFFRIQLGATNITCLGCADNAVATPAPYVVQIGRIFTAPGAVTREMTFPCTYYVFGFAQELYLVVNYDVDAYQWMAFGKSTVPGLVGHGGWCGATIGGTIQAPGGPRTQPVNINSSGGGNAGNLGYTSAALFWGTGAAFTGLRNWYCRADLDANGWSIVSGASVEDAGPGVAPLAPLVAIQPNVWNTESVLLPLRAYATRPSSKTSLIVDLQNARIFRIDNVSPGDILTIGPDKWKVFPWYRKDAAARNGGQGVNHTGTFGWAIRYEGP
jgi:hypothetical protein